MQRKSLVILVIACIAMIAELLLISAKPTSASAQSKPRDFGLPELHKINSVTLRPSYSCRSSEDFQKGYEETALFLSKYSRDMNSPELLFNGACRAEDYLESSLAGDQMSLIADLGEITLEDVAADMVFNLKRAHSFDLYSRFATVVRIRLNHTYAVVVNTRSVRGMFVFTVKDYVQNEMLNIRYAVKDYQILSPQAESPGFDWERRNF